MAAGFPVLAVFRDFPVFLEVFTVVAVLFAGFPVFFIAWLLIIIALVIGLKILKTQFSGMRISKERLKIYKISPLMSNKIPSSLFQQEPLSKAPHLLPGRRKPMGAGSEVTSPTSATSFIFYLFCPKNAFRNFHPHC